MERFGFAQSNVEFHQGFIEDLAAIGIEDDSVDVVISNCVINLSPFKDQVFAEIARVLKPGGELYFSDIFSDRRVPPKFYDDPVLRGECLSGALYLEDFRRILAKHGINAFYDVETSELHVGDFQIATKLGCIGFASHTVRAIKCDLEDREEKLRAGGHLPGHHAREQALLRPDRPGASHQGEAGGHQRQHGCHAERVAVCPPFRDHGHPHPSRGRLRLRPRPGGACAQTRQGKGRLARAGRGEPRARHRAVRPARARQGPAAQRVLPLHHAGKRVLSLQPGLHALLSGMRSPAHRDHEPQNHGRRAGSLRGRWVQDARHHRRIARDESPSGMVRARGLPSGRRGHRAQQT